MAYYIFPEYIPDIFYCIDLFMLMSSNSLLQSHFFKSHPSLKVGLNVAFFMESSMISVLLQNTKSLPPWKLLITFIAFTTYYLLWWLLCILCIYPTMLKSRRNINFTLFLSKVLDMLSVLCISKLGFTCSMLQSM